MSELTDLDVKFSIQCLLDKFPSLRYNNDDQNKKKKITCSLTRHEMPATVAAIESYIKGRKFKNASRTKMYNYDQHKPHIILSTKKKHLHELFCTLTLRHIAKSAVAIERHINGKRFQRAFARWQKCQETGEQFKPRGGNCRPGSSMSNSGSSNANVPFWSDDSIDDRMIDVEDFKDLYPDSEISNSNGKNKKRGYKESLPSGVLTATATSGSDSDYDMNTVDSISSQGPSLHSAFSRNEIKKHKRVTKQTNHCLQK